MSLFVILSLSLLHSKKEERNTGVLKIIFIVTFQRGHRRKKASYPITVIPLRERHPERNSSLSSKLHTLELKQLPLHLTGNVDKCVYVTNPETLGFKENSFIASVQALRIHP